MGLLYMQVTNICVVSLNCFAILRVGCGRGKRGHCRTHEAPGLGGGKQSSHVLGGSRAEEGLWYPWGVTWGFGLPCATCKRSTLDGHSSVRGSPRGCLAAGHPADAKLPLQEAVHW